MSGVGVSELVILLFIGLIVLGPERLPRVANQIGNWIGQARRMTRVMKRQLEDEIDFEKAPDIKPPVTRNESTLDKSTHVDTDQGDTDHADSETAIEDPLPANEHDDAFSPAHDNDSVGSGVGNEVGDDEGAEAEAEEFAAHAASENTDDNKESTS